MNEYSKRDVANIIGRSHRNITYWTDFGLVIPDIQPSQGRGISRIYSDRNLIEFGMIDIMNKDFGVNLDAVQEILQVLRYGKIEKSDLSFFFGKEVEEKRQRGIFEQKLQEFHFYDFYQNDEWGRSKELLAIETASIAYSLITEEPKKTAADRRRMTHGISFCVVDIDFDFNNIFKVKPLGEPLTLDLSSYNKILSLGSIKTAAANKLGVKLT